MTDAKEKAIDNLWRIVELAVGEIVLENGELGVSIHSFALLSNFVVEATRELRLMGAFETTKKTKESYYSNLGD